MDDNTALIAEVASTISLCLVNPRLGGGGSINVTEGAICIGAVGRMVADENWSGISQVNELLAPIAIDARSPSPGEREAIASLADYGDDDGSDEEEETASEAESPDASEEGSEEEGGGEDSDDGDDSNEE